MALNVTLENNYKQAVNGNVRNWTFNGLVKGSTVEKMIALNICDAVPSKK